MPSGYRKLWGEKKGKICFESLASLSTRCPWNWDIAEPVLEILQHGSNFIDFYDANSPHKTSSPRTNQTSQGLDPVLQG